MPDAIEHPSPLTSGDFTQADEPFRLFSAWMAEARASEPSDANAMALATSDASGLPNVRVVLLKGLDERGFVFYTNSTSQKGQELAGNAQAAAVFHWKSLLRQVRVRGAIETVTPEESDAYFATRPRLAQIAAWASDQSAPLETRFAFEKAIAAYTVKFAIGAVPRPPHWIGYRIVPSSIEFWHDRPYRMHDRVVFRRDSTAQGWTRTRLYP